MSTYVPVAITALAIGRKPLNWLDVCARRGGVGACRVAVAPCGGAITPGRQNALSVHELVACAHRVVIISKSKSCVNVWVALGGFMVRGCAFRCGSSLHGIKASKQAKSSHKGAVLGGVVLSAGLLGSSGVWAQCTDNYNYEFFVGSQFAGPSAGLGSVVSLISTINTVNTAFLTTSSAFVSSPPGAKPDQQSGGVWGRAVGGVVDTTTSSTTTLSLTAPADPATGQAHCRTKDHQTYAGVQFGYDLASLNSGGTGASVHFGVTGGYLQAFTKDTTPFLIYSNPFFGPESSPAGTSEETTKVPFGGLYVTFSQGGFFADAMVRWDFYRNSITDSLQGVSGLGENAEGFSVTSSAGYNMPLGGGWFLEPAGGLIYSRVHADSLSLPKFGILPVGNTVTIDTIESVLGRAGVSVGTNISAYGVTWQPYVTASVVHEFAGDVGVTQRSGPIQAFNGPGNPLCNPCFAINTFATSVDRIGTYGQYTLGTAVVLGNTGWLGYGRVDYRNGENIEGVSGNVGLRYQW